MSIRPTTPDVSDVPMHQGGSARVSAARQTLASLILLPMLLPLLLLLGVALTMLIGVNRTAQVAGQVSQSQTRMNILLAISKAVANLENGERGFLLTGDTTYLQPYLNAKVDFAEQVALLREVSQIEPQRQNLLQVEKAVQEWIIQLAEPEIQARKISLTQAVAQVQTGLGKRKLDEARTVLSTMQVNETARQRQAAQSSQATLNTVRLITLLGLGLGMLLLFLTLLRVVGTVSRSVDALTQRAQQITAGRYELPLPSTHVQELDALGHQFQLMSQAVQHREKALQTAGQALQATNQNLERSNRELERFAYVASHDLQEPLRTIGSYTELLAKRYQGQLDERADKYIEFTISATQRLKNLIQDLLAFSRVHRPGRSFTQVDTAELAAQVIEELDAKIQRAQATLQVEPLPQVRGNAELLHHVFLNLLTNAVKFRSPERPSQVSLSAHRGQQEWIFEVQDNGIGIAPQYHQKIFEVFQRLHGIGEYEGSGIGLAVTRSAIEQHGGRIWLTSTPGVGSTFYFTLADHPPEQRPAPENPQT